MRISVLLRLAPAAVASRQLAGEAEVVATGERAVIRNVEELLAFLAASAKAATPAASPATSAASAPAGSGEAAVG